MSFETTLVYLLLVAVIVFQHIQIQKLVNKLMCRSYPEYMKAVSPPVKEVKRPIEELEDTDVNSVLDVMR